MLMVLCIVSTGPALTPGRDWQHETAIGKTNYVTVSPVVRARSPGIISSIISEAKPGKPILIKSPKPNVGPRKCWRGTKTKKYRLRRVCLAGERTRP